MNGLQCESVRSATLRAAKSSFYSWELWIVPGFRGRTSPLAVPSGGRLQPRRHRGYRTGAVLDALRWRQTAEEPQISRIDSIY